MSTAYNKASRILGLINGTIEYKHTDILLRLYKSLVRLHLEYCIVSWSPHYKKDKILIERIQKRFTRMILSIKEFPSNPIQYSFIKKMTLSLKKCWRRSVLTRFLFSFDGCPLVRQHFFSERVINTWNRKLDSDIACHR